MTRQEALHELYTIFGYGFYNERVDEALNMAIKALEQDENGKENRNARIIYDFLKIKIGSKIVDNPFEFEDWYNRMIWHVQECNKIQKKYKGGETGEQERTEIIRCKNCRHDNNCEIQYAAQAGSEFFCGLAERREMENENRR